MKIVALETSTEACSAALLIDNEVNGTFRLAPREHTELILPMIDRLLADAGVDRSQLDGIAFGRGPGSFTGVRIATGVAQGIAFALDIPAMPVSTLAALAHRVWRESGYHKIVSALDARMGEVYWGSYFIEGPGRVQLHGEEVVCAPQAVPLPLEDGWTGAGSGWDSYGHILSTRLGSRLDAVIEDLYPHAHDIALLGATIMHEGRTVAASSAMPVYLRDQVVHRKPVGS